MKPFWGVIAFLLIAPIATAQEQTCDKKIEIAHAMMEELQLQVRIFSARAAQFYGNLSIKLNDANYALITTRLKLEEIQEKRTESDEGLD